VTAGGLCCLGQIGRLAGYPLISRHASDLGDHSERWNSMYGVRV
jgi:hypothetical protein